MMRVESYVDSCVGRIYTWPVLGMQQFAAGLIKVFFVSPFHPGRMDLLSDLRTLLGL